MPIINMHSTPLKEIKEGDVGLLIVKVMISGAHGLDGEWKPHFKLYRCPCPQTPGMGMHSLMQEPQGDKMYGTAIQLTGICNKLYPAVVRAGILPNPDAIR